MQKTLLVILTVTMFGCGSRPAPAPQQMPDDLQLSERKKSQLITQRLLQQYRQWRGAPYQLGGLNKQGVDCSGFVYKTFLTQFNLQLPRTTELQMALGKTVPFNDLRAGDLVFFKTGVKQRHVGIAIDSSRFLHASTSKGVTISEFEQVYWSEAFWMARRFKF